MSRIMIRSNFDKLRRRKAFQENRNLPLRAIAQETGLSLGTIQRVSSGSMERINMSTLDALCGYFDVATIAELIEYEPQKT